MIDIRETRKKAHDALVGLLDDPGTSREQRLQIAGMLLKIVGQEMHEQQCQPPAAE